ncbi:hypothetical protein TrVGV298_007015 [Trichoderma virens]|nr:hypothetical protein TrVGV298_007015 [Trichoderma virens]
MAIPEQRHREDRPRPRSIYKTILLALQVDQTNILLDIDQKIVLDRLPIAVGASFDSRAEEQNSICLSNTRVELLDQIMEWAKNSHTEPIFWLNAESLVIVIDALDECDPEDEVKLIIHQFGRTKSLGLKVFVTSRPELPIRLGFSEIKGEYQDFILHEISEPRTNTDN